MTSNLFVWIGIFAYLLFAVNAVIDKFLLHDRRIGHPATYAFAIGILSLLAVVLVPFGFFVPEAAQIVLALAAGAIFTYALLAFFAALKIGEATRVVPIQGGLVPFFTLMLAAGFFGERLSSSGIWAFLLLILGTAFLTMENGSKVNKGINAKTLALAVLAAALFALSFTLIKEVFVQLGFVNGFVWTRFGLAAGALTLLAGKGAREAILTQPRKTSESTGILFLTGQGVGALGAMAQNYAISLGSVTLVNALQGTQFLFLFVLTSFISLWYPRVLKEDLSKASLAQKIAGIVLVSAGVVVLAV